MNLFSIHGSPDSEVLAASGYDLKDMAIFSTNINPYGPPKQVVQAVQEAVTQQSIAAYPDRINHSLREQLAHYHNEHQNLQTSIGSESILLGNGSADLLWLIALTFAQQKRVTIFAPTFTEYATAISLVGATVTNICHPGWLSVEVEEGQNKFTPSSEMSLDEACNALAASSPELVFLCNPNNPTGNHLTAEALQTLYTKAPDAIWVIDEAYALFAEKPWSAVQWSNEKNWLVMRSLTKDFALGGLRLGYIAGHPTLIAQLQAAQSPWNVNRFALVAGQAVMHCWDWCEDTLARLQRDRIDFINLLNQNGILPHPTATNFFLIPVQDASRISKRLLEAGFMVRDCSSFGLPDYLRVATQRPEMNQRFVEVLTFDKMGRGK